MDDITTRTVVIGVGIIVTLTIVSLLIIMFFQMSDIYGVVLKTDTSIAGRFNDVYSMYDGKVTTGIGLLNAIKKYEDNPDYYVVIKYPKSDELRQEIKAYNTGRPENEQRREATELKKLMEQNMQYSGEVFRYENKYSVTVSEKTDGTLIIDFVRIV